MCSRKLTELLRRLFGGGKDDDFITPGAQEALDLVGEIGVRAVADLLQL